MNILSFLFIFLVTWRFQYVSLQYYRLINFQKFKKHLKYLTPSHHMLYFVICDVLILQAIIDSVLCSQYLIYLLFSQDDAFFPAFLVFMLSFVYMCVCLCVCVWDVSLSRKILLLSKNFFLKWRAVGYTFSHLKKESIFLFFKGYFGRLEFRLAVFFLHHLDFIHWLLLKTLLLLRS
jgi:hypothetical protein